MVECKNINRFDCQFDRTSRDESRF